MPAGIVRGRLCPQGAIRGLAGCGARAYGGSRRGAGRVGGPPFLCCCCFRGRVRGRGRVRRRSPPACAWCVFLGVCLPGPGAAGYAGRACVVVSSWVVHSMTSRRPGFGVCHLEWDDPPEPPAALRARAVVPRRDTGRSPGTGPGSLCQPGGTTPGTPRCASRPRGGTSPRHRPLTGHRARFAVSARGDDPPEPPAALRARAVVPRRDTGRSPGTGPGSLGRYERLAVRSAGQR